MDRYRFDDAYCKVYEYDSSRKAYLFLGSYYAFEITARMTTRKKVRIVERDKTSSFIINDCIISSID